MYKIYKKEIDIYTGTEMIHDAQINRTLGILNTTAQGFNHM